jgi:hypothetical protein
MKNINETCSGTVQGKRGLFLFRFRISMLGESDNYTYQTYER